MPTLPSGKASLGSDPVESQLRPSKKIARVQLDEAPEIADPAELAQGGQRRRGGRSSPLRSLQIGAAFLRAAAALQ